MKKYLAGIMSVLALVTLVATPALAATNSNEIQEPHYWATPKNSCESTRATLIKASGDLAFIRNTYYSPPGTKENPESTANYDSFKGPLEVNPVNDGTDTPLRKGKTNYSVMLANYQAADKLYSDQAFKDVSKTPKIARAVIDLKVGNKMLSAAIKKQVKSINKLRDDLNKITPKTYDCTKKTDQKKVADKDKARVKATKKINADIKNDVVKKASKKSTAAYKVIKAGRTSFLAGKPIDPSILQRQEQLLQRYGSGQQLQAELNQLSAQYTAR